MNPFNNCTFVGRIPDTDKIKYNYVEGNENKKSYIKGALSVRRSYKPKDAQYYPEDLISFTAFGVNADYMHSYVPRGSTVVISGSLQVDTVEGDDGSKRTYTSIIVDSVRAVGSNKKNDNNEDNSTQEEAAKDNNSNPFANRKK